MGNCTCMLNKNKTKPSKPKVVDHGQQLHQQQKMIRVVTTNGGVMELYAPITVHQITSQFPGHGLFEKPDPVNSEPLYYKFYLTPGQLYYLMPLHGEAPMDLTGGPTTSYRMSVDSSTWQRSDPDFGCEIGVWKVHLVIDPEQLSEILSQEEKTEELVESVRMVAKCGRSRMRSWPGSFSHLSCESSRGR